MATANRKSVRFREQQSVVDSDGKIISKLVRDFTVMKDQDSFFRIYITHVADLNKLSNTEKKFLLAVAALVEFNTNQICFNGNTNPKLCDIAGISEGVRRSLVSKLTKKGMFVKVGYLVYQLNPNFFFRGSDVDRSNILSMEYRWNIVDSKDEMPKGEEFNND
jgi:hypothetical protein